MNVRALMAAAIVASLGVAVAQVLGNVNLELRPVEEIVEAGEIVEIGLYAVSDDQTNQIVRAMQVILQWHPVHLELLGVENNGPYSWLMSGFYEDSAGDGLNNTFDDGDAYYQAVGNFQYLAEATPQGLLVTTLQFTALAPTPGTPIVIPPALGEHTTTQVFGEVPGQSVTGTLGSTVVAIPPPSFAAYNDVVYDHALHGAGTDPNGQSVHYIAPNVTTCGIGHGFSGSTSGELLDQVTGEPTGVTVTLTQDGGVRWQPMAAYPWHGGYDCAAGTDARDTFGGIADMTGMVVYGYPGWWVDMMFTGLDPARRYIFTTSASRAKKNTDGPPGYPDRYTIYTISGVDAATNGSTPGTHEYLDDPLRVWFNTGNNHDEGYVARWTGIEPGTDGAFKVRAEAHPDSPEGYKAYAFDAFMLRMPECEIDDDCDDTLFCNGAETCDTNGICQPGTPPDCDDGIGCTVDYCDAVSDTCVNAASNGLCDNGEFCDGVETCDPVLDCQAGTAVDCNDDVGCTVDMCNEVDDTCMNIPNNGLCDNGDYCDGVETCDPLLDCQAGTPVDCSDGVGCTVDWCDEVNDVCVNTASNGLCDDGNVCTDDVCDPLLGCQYSNNTDPCDDGLFCTATDACSNGLCLSSGNPCAAGFLCIEMNDQCVDPDTSDLLDSVPAGVCAVVDYVDVGDPPPDGREAGHSLPLELPHAWGPVEPGAHPAPWGGKNNPAENHFRTVWGYLEGGQTGDREADVTLDFGIASGPKWIGLSHLDGSCDESFDIYVDGAADPVAHYSDQGTIETWYTRWFGLGALTGEHVITFAATGDAGTCWDPYGHVAIDEIATAKDDCVDSWGTLSVELTEGTCGVEPGDTVTVLLTVSDLLLPINGVQSLIAFDEVLLDFVDITPGDGAGSPWDSAVEIAEEVDNGTITYAVMLLGSGSVHDAVVARIEFLVLPHDPPQVAGVELLPEVPPLLTKLTLASNGAMVVPELGEPIAIASPGDADADGDIDLVDYAGFASCLAGPGVASPQAECCWFDFDRDDDVDLGDFADFALVFTGG